MKLEERKSSRPTSRAVGVLKVTKKLSRRKEIAMQELQPGYGCAVSAATNDPSDD